MTYTGIDAIQVTESIEAMFEAGEPVGFVTTDLARLAAGLEPEAT